MGSLWGHLDEGLFFALLALWWIVNVCRDYVKVGCDPKRFEARLSYPSNIRGREINIEIYIKIFISIGGCMIEFIQNGFRFIDEDGNFRDLAAIQHISIYGLFIIHSFVDLFHWHRVPIFRGANYFTLAIGFTWYGLVFYFHTRGIVKDQLEAIVHQLGIFFNLAAALCILWEFHARNKLWPTLGRCLFVFSVGTWFIHVPFVLYSTDSFPGENPNPRWDRDNMMNAHFMVASFGLHLNMNICVILGIFFLTYCCHRRRAAGATTSGEATALKTRKLFNNVEYCLTAQNADDTTNGEATALLVSDEEV